LGLLPVHGFQRGEDAPDARIHGRRVRLAPADDSLAIDHEEGAAARLLLRAGHAERPRHGCLRVGVRKQRVADPGVASERLMAPDLVGGDREEHRAKPVELCQVVLVQRELLCRNRLPVGRMEDQNHSTAPKISQRNRGV
jgi:hypothetical protein